MSAEHPSFLRRHPKAAVAIAGGAAVFGLTQAVDITLPFNLKRPHISLDFGSDPAHSKGAVRQDSYETEEELAFKIGKQVSARVDVETFKNGPLGDGVVKKGIYGDMLLGAGGKLAEGEEGKMRAIAHVERDSATGKVIKVRIEFPGIDVVHPRVDHNDDRNCADVDPGDSKKEADKEIAKYRKLVADGKKPGCDDGFKVTQLAGPSSLAEAIPISYQAAQLGLALDANPKGEISKLEPRLRKDMKEETAGEYGVTVDQVELVNPLPQTPDELLAKRLQTVESDIRKLFPFYEFRRDNKGKTMFYAETNDGGHVTVTFTSDIKITDIGKLNLVARTPVTTPTTSLPSIVGGKL